MAAMLGKKPPGVAAAAVGAAAAAPATDAPRSGLLGAVLASAGKGGERNGGDAPDASAHADTAGIPAGTPPPPPLQSRVSSAGRHTSPLAPRVSWSPDLGGGGGGGGGVNTSPFTPSAKARLPSNTTRTSDLTDAARLATAAAVNTANTAAASSAQKPRMSELSGGGGGTDVVHSPMVGIAAAAKAAAAVRKATNAWKTLKQSKAAVKKQEQEEFRYKATSSEASHKRRAFQEAVDSAGNTEDNFYIENKTVRLPSNKAEDNTAAAARGVARVSTGARRR